MAKIYMNDFRVNPSEVPILRYSDENKTWFLSQVPGQ